MIRKWIIILILLIIFGVANQLHGLVQINVSGNWQETIDSTDLIYGSEIVLNSNYTSSANAVTVDIDAGVNKKWLVYVSKSDSYWDPRMHLYLKRTSNGIGKGKILGGESFQEITSVNQILFSGSKELVNIAIQFQLTGMSFEIPPASYSTNVTYTITDN